MAAAAEGDESFRDALFHVLQPWLAPKTEKLPTERVFLYREDVHCIECSVALDPRLETPISVLPFRDELVRVAEQYKGGAFRLTSAEWRLQDSLFEQNLTLVFSGAHRLQYAARKGKRKEIDAEAEPAPKRTTHGPVVAAAEVAIHDSAKACLEPLESRSVDVSKLRPICQAACRIAGRFAPADLNLVVLVRGDGFILNVYGYPVVTLAQLDTFREAVVRLGATKDSLLLRLDMVAREVQLVFQFA